MKIALQCTLLAILHDCIDPHYRYKLAPKDVLKAATVLQEIQGKRSNNAATWETTDCNDVLKIEEIPSMETF